MDKTEREKRIEQLRKELRTTRAHAASIIHAEEAAVNSTPPTPEEIKAAKEAMLTEEARESLAIRQGSMNRFEAMKAGMVDAFSMPIQHLWEGDK